jgi:hypothetical protein
MKAIILALNHIRFRAWLENLNSGQSRCPITVQEAMHPTWCISGMMIYVFELNMSI